MGSSSAPKPDANMGKAALLSAQTGGDMLKWMQDRAVTTDEWATQDRSRYKTTFQPLEDGMIAEAAAWGSPGQQATRAAEASADVRMAAGQQAGARQRAARAMGIDPRSGAYAAGEARAGVDTALAEAGAANLARRTVRNEGYARRADAVNLGRGLAVNPATSFGMGSSAGQAGFSGAMSGYGQQANILNNEWQGRMQAWQANQSMMGAMGGALGQLGGAIMFSSKEVKREGRPEGGNLEQIEALPVERWRYQPGVEDGGAAEHVGTYAEDWQRVTGTGDGRGIPVVDAVGKLTGAVQELSAKVRRMERGLPPQMAMAA